MYLTEKEYTEMGGVLSGSAFSIAERKAEYFINAQGNGATGKRIEQLGELPQAVKDCVFDLINHFSSNSFDGSNVQSESQSLGGQSESYTYSRMTKEEAEAEAYNLVFDYLYNIELNGVSILYAGAAI